MKTLTTLIMAISAIMFVACTADSLITEPNADLTIEQQDPMTKVISGQKFIFNGTGTMVRSRPDPTNICDKFYQIEFNGITHENTLGRFITYAVVCTDYAGKYSVQGSHIFQMRGDEIFFYSDKWGVDDDDNFWMIYEYYGGTGIYEGVTGMAKVYERATWTSNMEGTYTNHGEGTIKLK